jgi:methyl-accepting chemotaxis protein
MNTWNKALAAVALCAFSTLGHAETPDEARTMLTAAQAATGKGLAAAASEFNAGGKWKGKKAYIVLVDFKGNMLAHSDNNKMVGKNMLEAKDAGGQPFVQQTIKSVQEKGESLVHIRWSNPETKKIDNGALMARRVAGQDAYVGVAYFE